VAHDISERKAYEAALEKSSKQIIDIWESINDSFFALDSNGCFTYINHHAESMLQSTASEVKGKYIWDIFPEAVETVFYQKYREVMETRKPVHFEAYHESFAVWMEVHAYPSNDGITVYLRDVSEQRSAQDSIEELNAELERRVERLSVLHRMHSAISGSFDLQMTLNLLLSHLVRQLGADAARVWILPDSTLQLQSVAQIGFSIKEKGSAWIRAGEGLTGQVAQQQTTLQATSGNSEKHRVPNGFSFYYGLPLAAKGHLLGVLEVLKKEPFTPDGDWLEFLEALAAQATIAIDNSQLFTQLQRSNNELFLAYDTTIEGWSRALDLRDKETEGHSLRVTELTMQLAHAMGMSDAELAHVRRGALLHDIGKMGIPDAILLKPGPLSEEEWSIMRKHPIYAYELLSPVDFLRPSLDIPYCHHEKWDGSGYPRGLEKEQIPLSARLFAIVDVWDALTSDRPYRAAWTKERALAHIAEQVGIHFDPEVVKVFRQFIG
jgi:PAS domain S-box-containing protein/putative nucleotidyltransferase with HDIG domain